MVFVFLICVYDNIESVAQTCTSVDLSHFHVVTNTIYNLYKQFKLLKYENYININMALCTQCNEKIKALPIFESDGFIVCASCADSTMHRNKPVERLLFGNYDYYRCLFCTVECSILSKITDHIKHAHQNEKVYQLRDQPNGKLTLTNCTNSTVVVLSEVNLYRIDTNSVKLGLHISVIPSNNVECEIFKMQYAVNGALKMSGILPVGSTMHVDHPYIGESTISISCCILG